ncbi:MAG: threonine synthase, partial [Deltaproteobacteria bacterium]|nr:threonine synthase [Deltaproteobacteria bacterium]
MTETSTAFDGRGLSATFRCIAGCPGQYPVDQVIYTCPSCGDLLEVVHDQRALAARDASRWRALFEARWRSVDRNQGSGVWGKYEWVMPNLRPENIVSLGEGATPLTPAFAFAEHIGLSRVWIKQCGLSHTGSFKDLGMTVLVSMVNQMVADGQDIKAVACASTGDTSAALSAYAAVAGLPAVVILPRGKISTAQLVQPLANGAKVVAVDSDFDGCMKLVRQLAEKDGLYLANSMNSLRIEGQKTVSFDIAQQLGWEVPDWVIIPGGNLGNVSALQAGFAMLENLGLTDRQPRICVAQAERANPLYRAFQHGFEKFEAVTAGATAASAIRIGDPVSRDKAIRALERSGGLVEQASEQELADAAALADRTGMFTCPHTGVALAALAKLAAAGKVVSSDRVVVVSTANGLKFADFKVGYL